MLLFSLGKYGDSFGKSYMFIKKCMFKILIVKPPPPKCTLCTLFSLGKYGDSFGKSYMFIKKCMFKILIVKPPPPQVYSLYTLENGWQ